MTTVRFLSHSDSDLMAQTNRKNLDISHTLAAQIASGDDVVVPDRRVHENKTDTDRHRRHGLRRQSIRCSIPPVAALPTPLQAAHAEMRIQVANDNDSRGPAHAGMCKRVLAPNFANGATPGRRVPPWRMCPGGNALPMSALTPRSLAIPCTPTTANAPTRRPPRGPSYPRRSSLPRRVQRAARQTVASV